MLVLRTIKTSTCTATIWLIFAISPLHIPSFIADVDYLERLWPHIFDCDSRANEKKSETDEKTGEQNQKLYAKRTFIHFDSI